jgi:hypothetical protein
VDHVTDQLELSTSYARGPLNASIGYQASLFSNGLDALTWANPFTPVVGGATRAQLALAPDNQFHQISGAAGYVISPKIRASADFAFGRLTQDEPFLPLTTNTTLLAGAVPQASLQGKVESFDGSVRISATPMQHLRVQASYAYNGRENKSPIASYPSVATDMFVGTARSNVAFTFKQNRYKLSADYSGLAKVKLSAGFEENARSNSVDPGARPAAGGRLRCGQAAAR